MFNKQLTFFEGITLFPQDSQNSATQGENAKEGIKHGVIPATHYRTKFRSTDLSEGLDLAIGNGPMQDLDPITVGEFFKHTVKLFPNAIAMKFKDDSGEKWNTITYSKYYDLVIQAAKSFIKVGTIIHILMLLCSVYFPCAKQGKEIKPIVVACGILLCIWCSFLYAT